MMDTILTLIFGIILITGVLAPFIAGVNTDLLPEWSVPLLAFCVGIGILLVIWSFIKGFRGDGGKGI